ncbi:MAG: DUF2087 domain-containing protein [Rhodobacteraceae bacterium]|nr:DUF2087 domain-containing protein [Paracoccaceae bacterium]
MPRLPQPLTIADLSAFARRLRADLARGADAPGHLSLMNMLARAAGYGNYQHLRAAGASAQAGVPATAADPVLDAQAVAAALRCFDGAGHMVRWPAKTSVQRLCLAVLWAQIPARRGLSEPELNRIIDGWHGFGDRALVRRSLIDHRLCSRTADGRVYQRTEQQPVPEALRLIRLLAERAPPEIAGRPAP